MWQHLTAGICATARYSKGLMGRRNIAFQVASLLLLTTRVLGADASPRPTPWVMRSWQTEDGLPQNTVNAQRREFSGSNRGSSRRLRRRLFS
jgi:hypothetical protein